MSARASAVLSTNDARYQAVLLGPAGPDPSSLEHEQHLGAGVHLAVSLAQPIRWSRLSLTSWSESAGTLVAAVVGPQAAAQLRDSADLPQVDRDQLDQHLDIHAPPAAPWVRVAVIHALDRWLHAPLAQALLQAELGVAMLRAAWSLPSETEIREAMVDEALGWARRAADGVTGFLTGLDTVRRPLPPPLHGSIRSLVEGYADLRAQVSGPDAELTAVLTAAKALAGRTESGADQHRSVRRGIGLTPGVEAPRPSARVVSMIDPRHVRARVLGLGERLRAGEISLARAQANGKAAVRVRVPAFESPVDSEIAERLMARLVNRRSGHAVSFAPLVMRSEPGTRSRPPFFECTMPLFAPLEELRADVYDALFHAQLGDSDTEADVLRVRRAVLALRRHRSRAAQGQLVTGAPPGTGPDRPLLAELAAAYPLDAA